MNVSDKTGFADLLAHLKDQGVNPNLNLKDFRAEYELYKTQKTPVLIQVLIFLGAILGAAFLLGTFALMELFNSPITVTVLGLIIGIAGLVIPYQSKQEATIEPIGMALLIVGCTLFSFGFLGYGKYNFTLFLMISLLTSIVVMFLAGSHLQKIAAIFCANFCAYWLIWEMNIGIGYNFLILLNAAIITIACLREPHILVRMPKLGQWYMAILNGCSVSMLLVLTESVNRYQRYHWETVTINPSYWWLSSLLLVGLVLWILHETLDLVGEKIKKVPILIAVGLALLLLIKAPGVVAGILLLFLGIYGRYPLFAAQGILAIFFFIGMFYYNLETTFLFKSLLAVGSGIIFMGLGYALKRVYDHQILKNNR